MAQKLADQTYFEDFAGGQGAGFGSYTDYAQDQDTNFTAIRSTVDQIIDEVSSLGGPSAAVALDLLLGIDPASTTTLDRTLSAAIIGSGSYGIARISSNTQLQVDSGAAFANGGRIQTNGQTTLPGSGGAGTRYVALQADGTLTLETSTSQGVLDLYSATWDGAAFSADPDREALVYPEGDDFLSLLSVTGLTGGAIPPQTNADLSAADAQHVRIQDRVENIERVLNGLRTNNKTGGPALGDIVVPGSAAAPGLVFGDGTTTVDATTGFYRDGLNNPALSIDGSLCVEWTAERQQDSPTFGRVRATVAADTIGTGAYEEVQFDTQAHDVGGYFAPTSPDFTVPTGHGGLFTVKAIGEFAANATGQRGLQITVNNTAVTPEVRVDAAASGVTGLALSIDLELAAADVVSLEAFQDSGGNLSLQADLSLTRFW